MAAGMVRVSPEALDAMQQRLFAIALGLRSLQIRAVDDMVARDLEGLEGEVDWLIRELRCHASAAHS